MISRSPLVPSQRMMLSAIFWKSLVGSTVPDMMVCPMSKGSSWTMSRFSASLREWTRKRLERAILLQLLLELFATAFIVLLKLPVLVELQLMCLLSLHQLQEELNVPP